MSNNKYEKAKIYKIWSTQGNKIYIGSTTKDYLSQRMTAHRGDYKKWKRGTHGHVASYILFEEYGLENCFIELLEAKSCSSIDEVRRLEGKYIRELECVNKCIAGQTRHEYIKQYTENNKEHITEYKKNYYNDNKDEIKEKQTKYYNDNKVSIMNHVNNYRKENNDIITCDCGGTHQRFSKARHFKTSRHRQFIESQNNLIQ